MKRNILRLASRWVVALFGAALSAATVVLALGNEDARVQAVFEREVDWELHSLDRQVRAMLEPLAPLALAYGRGSIATDDLLEQFGAQARSFGAPVRRLSWSPHVSADLRGDFVAMQRGRLGPDFDIREQAPDGSLRPAGQRAEYFPIVQEVVFAGTASVLGFDVASDVDRRQAVERARADGVGTATIAPPTTGGLSSLVVRWPVFDQGRLPPSVAERRHALRGFVNAAFDSVEVLNGALDARPGGGGRIIVSEVFSGRYDVAHWDAAAARLAAGAATGQVVSTGSLRFERSVLVYGLPLTIVLRVPPRFVAAETSPAPWFLGLLGAGLTIAVLYLIGRRERDLEAAAELRAQIQAALAQAQDRLHDAIESLPCGFFLFDAQTRLVAANGWSRDLLADLGIDPLAANAAGIARRLGETKLRDADADAGGGRPSSAALAGFRADSLDFEEDWTDGHRYQVIQRRTARDNIVRVYLDVTGRHQAEAQLRQAQRMEAIGQLTGGIAHDFNNLLLVIIMSLDMLRDADVLEPPYPKMVDNAYTAATRAADLTRRLLAFARPRAIDGRPVDLAELVTGMQGLLEHTVGAMIAIEMAIDPDLPPVLTDRGQLENALLNLAINARDAMPRGGRLRIGARRRADGLVAVAVSDTGEGMPPEVVRRAFEPFFTTKPVGKGTGLGLSMIYGFARQSGGTVDIASKPGEGTTVTLVLPCAADGDAVGVAPAAETDLSRGQDTILLVDDDPQVRIATIQLLEQLGYRVLAAESGAEALALVDREGEIDLLLSDYAMPGGLTGDTLAEQAQGLRPGIKVLLSSGFAESEIAALAMPGRDWHFIAKPYRANDLAAKLRTILGPAQAASASASRRKLTA